MDPFVDGDVVFTFKSLRADVAAVRTYFAVRDQVAFQFAIVGKGFRTTGTTFRLRFDIIFPGPPIA